MRLANVDKAPQSAGSPQVALAEAREKLWARAMALAPRDRLLMQTLLRDHLSVRQLALLLGENPGTVTRRIQRLSRRLNDPIVIALLEYPGDLRPEARQLAVEYLLHGASIARLCEIHQMKRREVTAIIDFAKGWLRARCARR